MNIVRPTQRELARPVSEEPKGRTRMSGIYELLRRDILECRLKPGVRLRFEELRALYEIGLSPLREALMKLASDGLVVLEEHKGFGSRRCRVRICWTSRSCARNSMRWASDCRSRRVMMPGRRASSPRSMNSARSRSWGRRLVDSEWEKRHRAFHLTLVSACGSPWLLHFREQLYDQADRYRRLSVQYLREPRDHLGEHREIAEAALARDADAAVFLIRRHLDRTVQILLAAEGFFPRAWVRLIVDLD